MTHDIFISYRRDGGEDMAMFLYERLTALGYGAFIDVKELRSGKFDEKLLSEIDGCKDFIVICSKNCFDRCVNDGDWFRAEIAYAFKRGKNIIPLMLRGFEFPPELPGDIAEIRRFNGIEIVIRYFNAAVDLLEREYLTAKSKYARIPRPHAHHLITVGIPKAGGIIRLGGYNWRILTVQDGRALALSADVLELKAYNRELKAVGWETCTLRAYLNGEFFGGFSEADRERVFETCGDFVFLLTSEQARRHLVGNTARKAKLGVEFTSWWLKTPGESKHAKYVSANGTVYEKGLDVYYGDVGVRPAIWVTING